LPPKLEGLNPQISISFSIKDRCQITGIAEKKSLNYRKVELKTVLYIYIIKEHGQGRGYVMDPEDELR
jgi:hypothetical protein